uniref:K Homology domain-containing protein n=1 Tax=Calcidiscus leptoporus TaxID=127549 RepID=A0A7S0P4S3_9EUKA
MAVDGVVATHGVPDEALCVASGMLSRRTSAHTRARLVAVARSTAKFVAAQRALRALVGTRAASRMPAYLLRYLEEECVSAAGENEGEVEVERLAWWLEANPHELCKCTSARSVVMAASQVCRGCPTLEAALLHRLESMPPNARTCCAIESASRQRTIGSGVKALLLHNSAAALRDVRAAASASLAPETRAKVRVRIVGSMLSVEIDAPRRPSLRTANGKGQQATLVEACDAAIRAMPCPLESSHEVPAALAGTVIGRRGRSIQMLQHDLQAALEVQLGSGRKATYIGLQLAAEGGLRAAQLRAVVLVDGDAPPPELIHGLTKTVAGALRGAVARAAARRAAYRQRGAAPPVTDSDHLLGYDAKEAHGLRRHASRRCDQQRRARRVGERRERSAGASAPWSTRRERARRAARGSRVRGRWSGAEAADARYEADEMERGVLCCDHDGRREIDAVRCARVALSHIPSRTEQTKACGTPSKPARRSVCF